MRPTMSVKIDKSRLDAVRQRSPQKAGQIVRAMALDGQRDVQMSFGTSPSAPGSPPGIDTGALKNSIRVEPVAPFVQSIRTGVDYDAYLEYGTQHILPRPYMMPMAMRLQARVDEYFKTFIT